MKALVTGANGFVGRFLLGELSKTSAGLIAIDVVDEDAFSRTSEEAFLPDATYIKCDLTDRKAVLDVVRAHRPERIFHLAAQSSSAASFRDPKGTLESNLLGALNILEAARIADHGPRILLVGSSEEYGRRSAGEMPLKEKSPVEPVSPYAASKAAQNLLAMQYFRAFKANVILTRSFSHTGPGQKDIFVLPSFARQCAAVKAGLAEPVIMTGNLDIVRDFLDVRDVARAYSLLMERGRAGETYNVCSGTGLRIGDALEKLTGLTGMEVSVETDKDLLRPVDVPVLIGDNGKIRKDTGWTPWIMVDEMLADLMQWWEKRIRDIPE